MKSGLHLGVGYAHLTAKDGIDQRKMPLGTDTFLTLSRYVLFRYDQIKNNHFVQGRLALDGDTYTFWMPVPAIKWMHPKNQDSAPFYWEEKILSKFLLWNMPNMHDVAGARDSLYFHFFNARYDSDFPDKTTQKYQHFSALRKALNLTERVMGNTLLSVYLGFVIWYSECKAERHVVSNL